MSLIFITGVSGAGKSTVRAELSRRGFQAYDTDEDEIAVWQHKVTGQITRLLADAHRTPEFIAENEWRGDPERVRRLAELAEGRTVFVCGLVSNDEDIVPYFDTVIFLQIDEATMRHRLATRTSHDFGTKPHELELLLVWRQMIEQHYVERGAVVVDAGRSPVDVADEILRTVVESAEG